MEFFHEPCEFQALGIHTLVNKFLIQLSQNQNVLPHIILHGSNGSGKMTRAKALINLYLEKYKTTLFQSDISHPTQTIELETKSGKKIELQFERSLSHIYFTLPEQSPTIGTLIVETLLEPFIHSHAIQIAQGKEKFIIINGLDRFPISNQNFLHELIEEASSHVHFIFIAESISHISKPLKSRCRSIRIKTPSFNEIRTVLEEIWKSCVSTTHPLAKLQTKMKYLLQIAQKCNGNLTLAKQQLLLFINNSQKLKELAETPQGCVSTTLIQKCVNPILVNPKLETVLGCKELLFSYLIVGIQSSDIITILLKGFITELEKKTNVNKTILINKILEQAMQSDLQSFSQIAQHQLIHLMHFVGETAQIISEF